jgi:hypothetical protein
MAQEMGAPGYPAGDEMQETAQGETNDTTPGDEQQAAAGDETVTDGEQGAGEDDPNLEMIRRRAWEISQGSDAGTDEENWVRAEREVRTEQASP